jgi:hypothetical protein
VISKFTGMDAHWGEIDAPWGVSVRWVAKVQRGRRAAFGPLGHDLVVFGDVAVDLAFRTVSKNDEHGGADFKLIPQIPGDARTFQTGLFWQG